MSRMNLATYEQRKFPVTAVSVRNNFEDFDNSKFRCIKCGVKVAFNRGIDKNDPHFKNWPNVNHYFNCACEFEDDDQQHRKHVKIEQLRSLILEIVKEKKESSAVKYRQVLHINSPAKKKFLYSLVEIIDYRNNSFISEEYNEVAVRTEDGEIIKARDLILRQDSAIRKYDNIGKPYIAIIIGYVSRVHISAQYAIVYFSSKGKYGNEKPFKLMVYKDRLGLTYIKETLNHLVICYGFVGKYNDDYQMEIFRPRRQLVMVERHPSTSSS